MPPHASRRSPRKARSRPANSPSRTRAIRISSRWPWSQTPRVKGRMATGRAVKVSFCVNHNSGGPTLEPAKDRGVAKPNSQAFHPDWAEHWANELEFAFEK